MSDQQPPPEPLRQTTVTTGRFPALTAGPTVRGDDIDVWLTWDSKDPVAIVLRVQYPGEVASIEWHVCPYLLRDGGGLGDVFVVHTDLETCIICESPYGIAELILPADRINEFITHVMRALPADGQLSILGSSEAEWEYHWEVLTKPSPSDAKESR